MICKQPNKSNTHTYKIRAKVVIDIETDIEDTSPPSPDTIKFCIDQDIAGENPIEGAIDNCEVISFSCKKIE